MTKELVLEELYVKSWMKDAGWSKEQIAAKYRQDRDHKVSVIRERRKKFFERSICHDCGHRNCLCVSF